MTKFLWILVFVMSNKVNSHPGYKILSVEELNKIEEAKRSQTDTSYIIEYNGAFATLFKDGTSIILPPVLGGKEGLFFYSVADMNEMIKSKTYPVRGTNSFWEKERPRVLHFADAMPYYCSVLTELLDYKVALNYDKAYLKELSGVVSQRLQSKKDKKILQNYLSIYISELLRHKVKGEWRLAPQKALNVYYIPEITKGDKFCSPWSFVTGQLEMASFVPVDIESLIERADVFYPTGNRNYLDK